MSDFKKARDIQVLIEGDGLATDCGASCISCGSRGKSKYGITPEMYANYLCRKKNIPGAKCYLDSYRSTQDICISDDMMKALTRPKSDEIAKDMVWDETGIGLITSQELANLLFDIEYQYGNAASLDLLKAIFTRMGYKYTSKKYKLSVADAAYVNAHDAAKFTAVYRAECKSRKPFVTSVMGPTQDRRDIYPRAEGEPAVCSISLLQSIVINVDHSNSTTGAGGPPTENMCLAQDQIEREVVQEKPGILKQYFSKLRTIANSPRVAFAAEEIGSSLLAVGIAGAVATALFIGLRKFAK